VKNPEQRPGQSLKKFIGNLQPKNSVAYTASTKQPDRIA